MKILERFLAFLNYHRRVVAAICAGLCMAGLVSLIESRPLDGEPVVALAREVEAGTLLAADDLTTVDVPASLATAHSIRDLEEAVGAVMVVAGDANTPLTSHALLRGAAAAEGHSLVPITVPDDDLRALLHPGQVVELIVAFEGAPETVTDRARVAKLPAAGSDTTLGAASGRVVLVEVPSDVAHVVATLGQAGQLGVILSSR